MNVSQRALATLSLVILSACGASSPSDASEVEPNPTGLGIVLGCWSGAGSDGSELEESYRRDGENIVGSSSFRESNEVVANETTSIVVTDEATTLTPTIQGQPSVPFTLLPSTHAQTLVFENREHDFPQRIIYRREGVGTLVARIEGMSMGTDHYIEWRMHECPRVR